MNERIRKLAEQACFDEIGKDYSLYFNLTKDKVEKFAELIVRECAAEAHRRVCIEGNDNMIYVHLLEHFGVKE